MMLGGDFMLYVLLTKLPIGYDLYTAKLCEGSLTWDVRYDGEMLLGADTAQLHQTRHTAQYGQTWFLSFQRPPSDFRGVSSEIRGGVN